MKTAARLAITPLEDRTVPAGFGNAWVDTNLTASFAPDGTDVGGAPSALFGTLGARMSTAEWQGAVRSALQSWVAAANLNVGFVADDGRAFGTPGPVQGSPFVGDVRIAARPLSDNVLAISNPFDLVSPWAGEIVINSNKAFSTTGAVGTYDLRAVVLHEFGHVLGIAGSTDPGSVMFENYEGTGALSAGDVAAVTALYGARGADRYEGFQGNDTVDNATPLNYISDPSALAGIDPAADATRYAAQGDLRSATDADVYKISLPKGVTTVLVQTGGISQARLRIAVLNSSGKEVASTTVPDSTGLYKITYSVKKSNDFYVSVTAANGSALDVGSYRLAVGNALTDVPTSTLSTRVQNPYFGYDARADWVNGTPSDDSFEKAQWLGVDLGRATARWDYTGSAGIDTAADADIYAVTTTWNPQQVLMVAVWAPTGGPTPAVEVYDQNRNLVPGAELVRNGSSTVLQIDGLAAWSTYYVRVTSAEPGAWRAREAYRFGIDFRTDRVALETLANGTLAGGANQISRALSVTRSQAFAFELSALSVSDTADTAARLTVFDAGGNAVFTMTAGNGETARGLVLLPPGTYTVVIVGATRYGSPLKGLVIDARFLALTDPIGPGLTDDYGTTGAVCAAPADTSDAGFFWLAPPTVGSGFLDPTSFYSSPWW